VADRAAQLERLRRPSPTGSVGTPPLPVLYDADCGFCRWTLALLLRRDRTVRLLPLAIQSAEGARLLEGMPEAERLRSAHVVTPDGRVWSGGDAVAPIARELAGHRAGHAAWLWRLPLRAGYRLVAANRSRLSRLVPRTRRDAAAAAIEEHRRRASVAS
jgi:predicted DCC family thiol-disulfide oxidoreductase YuxK